MPPETPAPWWSEGLRFQCQPDCGNCCTGEPGFVWVSSGEASALADFLGLDEATFAERHLRRVGSRTSLKEDDLGDCTFFDSKRRTCGVYPVRPKQCATWPFWKENLKRERWDGPVRDTCPGIGSGPLYSAQEIERSARETEEWYGAE